MSWKKLGVLGLIAISGLIIWKTHQIWSAAFLGLLFALSLNGLAEWLGLHIRMPRWLATLLVMFVVLLTLTGLGWIVASPLQGQFEDLSRQLPSATQKGVEWLEDRSWGRSVMQRVEEWSGVSGSSSRAESSIASEATERTTNDRQEEQVHLDRRTDTGGFEKDESSKDESSQEKEQSEDTASAMPDFLVLLSHIASALSLTVKNGALLFLSIIVMLFVAFDPYVYQRGVLWLVPQEQEKSARQTMDRLCTAMRWWMTGRLASMAAVGVLTSLGMWMIGMPAPLALGVIAGLLAFVPNFGPIAAAIPGMILAFGQSPWMVVWAACIYLAAQLVESSTITPLVEQYAIAIPPGVLIVTQFVMAALAGVWGMIIATPLLVVVMVLVQQLYVNQGLAKHIEVTGSK